MFWFCLESYNTNGCPPPLYSQATIDLTVQCSVVTPVPDTTVWDYTRITSHLHRVSLGYQNILSSFKFQIPKKNIFKIFIYKF